MGRQWYVYHSGWVVELNVNYKCIRWKIHINVIIILPEDEHKELHWFILVCFLFDIHSRLTNCKLQLFSLVLWVISTGFGVVLAIFNALDNELAIYGCGIWSSFPSLPAMDLLPVNFGP